MAKKAKKKLSTRERSSRKINRQRQWRKWWQTSQRFFVLATLAGILGVAGGGWWFWHSGRLNQMEEAAADRFWHGTANLGFKVEHVYLEGRRFTPLADINEALGVRTDDPILALSLPELRSRLQAIPRVKYAEIARILPNRLDVHVVERQPIAVWQNEGKLHLIDDDGIVMEYVDPKDYRQLMLIVGDGAPSHAHDLLAMMTGTPNLYKEVASASRVGERRWDIRFKNGVVLKLPEQNQPAAWDNFARMEQDQHLLERAVKSIDMRLADRVFIKLVPAAAVPKADIKEGRET